MSFLQLMIRKSDSASRNQSEPSASNIFKLSMDRDSREQSARLAIILREFNLNNPGAWLLEYLVDLVKSIAQYLDKVSHCSTKV